MKIANIETENLHIFWKICGISMKLSGKMWVCHNVKSYSNSGFHSVSRRYIFGKTTSFSWETYNIC